MKRMCLERKGIEAVLKLPALLKRLHNLAEDLAKKAAYEKRFDEQSQLQFFFFHFFLNPCFK